MFFFPAAPSVLKIITEYVAEKLNVQKSTQNRKKKNIFAVLVHWLAWGLENELEMRKQLKNYFDVVR